MQRLALLLASVCVVGHLAAPTEGFDILLDSGNVAHTFDGIGALSAGASSRLLWDYDADTRDQILDLLFKPNYGASLHILKIEIGGDTQSTDGSEPSHEHTDGDLDCSRGYETWLVKEAKRRQPNIRTYGLSWGVPGWVGDESYFSSANVKYQVDWMLCMRSEAQVDIDYLGIWNEKPWGSINYTLQLRKALDSAGFPATELVMLDGGSDVGFRDAIRDSTAFQSSFSTVGLHYPCNAPAPDYLGLGKKYWASEEGSIPASWGGAGCWGRMLNQNYVRMNMTASIMWSLIWSAYPNLDCFGNGLMYAFQPWSGNFSVNTPVWTTAHTTQFVEPGWRYLQPGSGTLPDGGTFVSLIDGLGNLTVILETLTGRCMYHDGCFHDHEAEGAQLVTLRLGHGLHVDHLVAFVTNQTHHFLRLPDLPLATDGTVSVKMPPDTLITITTPGNGGRQSKAGGTKVPPPSDTGRTAPFPLPFKEAFSQYPKPVTGRMVTYFADESGSWEASDGVLRQVVRRPPGKNQWSCNSDPFTHFGDANWSSYIASVRVRVTDEAMDNRTHVSLCARMIKYAGFRCGEIPGYCLHLHALGWSLVARGYDVTRRILASGDKVVLTPWTSYTLSLQVQGTFIEASIDGMIVAVAQSTAAVIGQVALQSGWHRAEFDDVLVLPLAAPCAPPSVFRHFNLWSHGWSDATCEPIPRDLGQGRRNNYGGYVGMRIRVLRAIEVVGIGRWRSDADVQSHGLLLLGVDKGLNVTSTLSPDTPPDTMGFAYARIPQLDLQPGVYDVLSQEFEGGDFWLDQGISVEEEDWVQVMSSVSGANPASLTVSLPRTTYGPLNLLVRNSLSPEQYA